MGKSTLTILCLLGFLIAGCGSPDTTTVSDGKGNTVSVTDDGSKVTYEGSKGESATMETDSQGGSKVTVKTDKGDQTMSAGSSMTEDELGMPFYPGSSEKEGSSLKTDTPDGSSRLAVRVTADTPAKVVAYYKDKLSEPSTMSASSGGNEHEILTGKLANGATVQITAARDKGATETVVNVLVTRTNK